MNIQTIVDELCGYLRCSVAVDDSQMQLLAASAQLGKIDLPRSEAILNRHTPDDVAAYGLSMVMNRGNEPFQVAANSELGTLPRWCFPLAQGTEVLGYLWLIDDPEISDHDLDVAEEYSTRLTLEISAAQQAANESTIRSAHYLSEMLQVNSRPDLENIIAESPLPTDGVITVWCFAIGSHTETSAKPNPTLNSKVVEWIQFDPLAPTLLTGTVEDSIAVITRTQRSAQDVQGLLVPVITRATTNRHLTLAGIGWKEVEISQLPMEAWRQAEFAAQISGLSRDSAPVGWRDLGAWSLLYQQPQTVDTVRQLSPECMILVEHENQHLWKTLLQYFDSACDIMSTATALHVERSTLYYRLTRIKEIAGEAILTEGWNRTSAHLALKFYERLQAFS